MEKEIQLALSMKKGFKRVYGAWHFYLFGWLVLASQLLYADSASNTQRLLDTRLFARPMVWVGQNPPSEAESVEIWNAFGIEQHRKFEDAVADLDGFVAKHPNSPWAPSINCNLGQYYRDHGYFTLALAHWSAAWESCKNLHDDSGKAVADDALAHRLILLCSLGRTETLEVIFDETKGRTLIGPMQQMYNQAKEACVLMQNEPQNSYRCGSYALASLVQQVYKTNDMSIRMEPSPATGFSMGKLVQLAYRRGYEVAAVQRPIGSGEIVVPSVVHWKQNHYAAIIAKRGDRYEVADPTFRLHTLLTAAAINEESSGQFIVSSEMIPQGWQRLSGVETATIFGKGGIGAFAKPPAPPCDGCSCAPGAGGSGGNGSNGNSPGSNPSQSGTGCSTCSHNSPSSGGTSVGGMPDWTVLEPYIDLWVHDEPMAYEPATGSRISFKMWYWQRDDASIDPAVATMGPSWNFSWFSYIDYTNIDLPSVKLYPAGGGEREYTDLSGTVPEYSSNTRMAKDLDGSGNLKDFRLIYPSGAVDVYGLLRTNLTGQMFQAYLTAQINPFGRTNTFVYAPYNPSSTLVKLLYMIDADGGTNALAYTGVSGIGSTFISAVTNRYGQVANFKYDQNGYLTNVTDVAGISSAFHYDQNQNYWMTNMVTPYGPTRFQYTDDDFSMDYNVSRSAIVTQPNGAHQMFIFREDSTSLNNSDNTSLWPYQIYPKPDSDFITCTTVNNNGCIVQDCVTNSAIPADGDKLDGDGLMIYRNTYYWGPQQFDNLSGAFQATGPNWDFTQMSTNDYLLARMRHHNHDLNLNAGLSVSIERDFSPDGYTVGEMTWYNYPNKPDYFQQGSSAFPSLIIKTLPDGTGWYRQFTTDQYGNNTNVVSTYTSNGNVAARTNVYVYAANGQDLLREIGPDGITNAIYVYNANHQVLFVTNAIGEGISYTYDPTGRITSVTSPAGLQTTYSYGSDGYLSQQSVIGFSTNLYTYTNGLVYSHTDERGLTVTNTWDALRRLTSVTYPDGTSIVYTYSNLDLTRVIDRMGFTNSYVYNAIRQKIYETNWIGAVTSYGYCDCGALAEMTNALGLVTSFSHDVQGNLTQIIYPDGYVINNIYDLARNLVVQTDSSGMCVTNYYNNQGFLAAQTNSVGRAKLIGYDINNLVTSVVDANGVVLSFTYDPLRRLKTRGYSDGGVESWGYAANYWGPIAYTNQIGNVTLYGYDAANRQTNIVQLGVFTNGYAYNGAGDLIKLTDGNRNTTSWGYDNYGRANSKLDTLGETLFTYAYDQDDRLTNKWSATKGNVGYSYDAVGNLVNVHYPLNKPINLKYDVLNHLTSIVDGIGTNTYSYDAAGQLLYEDGPWINDTVSYIYTNRLRVYASVQMPSESAWWQSYEYDQGRRLIKTTSPVGAFAYVYNPVEATRVDQLNLPGGMLITNKFDSLARQTQTQLINSSGTDCDSYNYTYNQAGQRTTVVRTLSDYVNYTYDGSGEIKTVSAFSSNGLTNRVAETINYSYDAAGNLVTKTNPTLAASQINYRLNALNEITNSLLGGPSGGSWAATVNVSGWATPAATSVAVNSKVASLYSDKTFATNLAVVNGANTFTATAQDISGRTATCGSTINIVTNNSAFLYDTNGNLVSDGYRGFAYDDENQLVSVWLTNVWRNDFAYDGRLRRRIEKDYIWANSSWMQTNEMHFIYDGNVVVQVRDVNNVPSITYTRGIDLSGSLQGAGGIGGLLARTDMPQWSQGGIFAHSLYHSDANGNITCLMFTNQTIAARYLYDAFGSSLGQFGALAEANTYRFSSKEWNANAGIYYYLYRFYDPSMLRWLNRDPFGESGGINLFEMSANDVVNHADFYGLFQTFPVRVGPITSPINGPIPLPRPMPIGEPPTGGLGGLGPVLGPVAGGVIVFGAGCMFMYGVATCTTQGDTNPGGVNCWNTVTCTLPTPTPKPGGPPPPTRPPKCPGDGNNDKCKLSGSSRGLCIYTCTRPDGSTYTGTTTKKYANQKCDEDKTGGDMTGRLPNTFE